MIATRLSWLRGAIPAVAVMALALTACGNKKSTSENESSESVETSLKTDSIYWDDSISTPKGNKAYCRISVEYPVEGNPQLLDSLRLWIAQQLSTNCMISNDTVKPSAVPGALLADGQKYIAQVGTHVLEMAKPEITDLENFGVDSGMTYEYYWSINNIYSTDRFVTYASSTYCYLGGAHGGSGFNPQVFAIDSGERFGWNMFRTDSLPSLKEHISKELMTGYFEVKTFDDFRDCLLVNPDTLPLPATPPYFTDEGVHFCYQQYEIAPYAAGMPGCILPFAVVRPMLTPEAANLLPAQ